jgi:threonyl-tRNA synthetase
MDQIEKEITNTIDFIKCVYKKFNMEFVAGLSTRPEQYLGTVELWNKVEGILKSVLDKNFEKYNINDGDGAFYGAKIDFKVLDTLGREHQLATIQLDFNLPERFKLEFRSEDGYEQPVMIHRAIFGSIERFIAILLESGQGNIPLFVSPRQVAILTITDNKAMVDYAFTIKENLNKAGIKYVDLIDEKDTISKKILNTEMLHYNRIIVIGNKEIKNNTINVRGLGEMSCDDFIGELIKEINN